MDPGWSGRRPSVMSVHWDNAQEQSAVRRAADRLEHVGFGWSSGRGLLPRTRPSVPAALKTKQEPISPRSARPRSSSWEHDDFAPPPVVVRLPSRGTHSSSGRCRSPPRAQSPPRRTPETVDAPSPQALPVHREYLFITIEARGLPESGFLGATDSFVVAEVASARAPGDWERVGHTEIVLRDNFPAYKTALEVRSAAVIERPHEHSFRFSAFRWKGPPALGLHAAHGPDGGVDGCPVCGGAEGGPVARTPSGRELSDLRELLAVVEVSAADLIPRPKPPRSGPPRDEAPALGQQSAASRMDAAARGGVATPPAAPAAARPAARVLRRMTPAAAAPPEVAADPERWAVKTSERVRSKILAQCDSGHGKADQMWPVYKLFDTGGAGTIDVKEFVRGLASYHARPSSKIQAQPQPLKRRLRLAPEQEIFALVDLDKDGEITYKEFQKWVRGLGGSLSVRAELALRTEREAGAIWDKYTRELRALMAPLQGDPAAPAAPPEPAHAASAGGRARGLEPISQLDGQHPIRLSTEGVYSRDMGRGNSREGWVAPLREARHGERLAPRPVGARPSFTYTGAGVPYYFPTVSPRRPCAAARKQLPPPPPQQQQQQQQQGTPSAGAGAAARGGQAAAPA